MQTNLYRNVSGSKYLNLKKKRKLSYLKEKEIDESKIVSSFYIVLKDLNKEKDIFKKDVEEYLDECNVLFFKAKDYLIYKVNFDEKEKYIYQTDYIRKNEYGEYEINPRYIKGYTKIVNQKNEEFIIPIVSKNIIPIPLFSFIFSSSFIPVSALAGASIVAATIGGITYLNRDNAQKDISFATDSTEYDDSPVTADNDEIDSSNEDIQLNLILDQTVTDTSTIPFANYSSNIDNLRYLITKVDDENIIYDTGIISPGKVVNWKVSDYLETGSYALDIYLIPYTSDGEEGMTTRIQTNVTINVQ